MDEYLNKGGEVVCFSGTQPFMSQVPLPFFSEFWSRIKNYTSLPSPYPKRVFTAKCI